MNCVLFVVALGVGGMIAYVDSRPTWDDTGVTAAAIFGSCFLLGCDSCGHTEGFNPRLGKIMEVQYSPEAGRSADRPCFEQASALLGDILGSHSSELTEVDWNRVEDRRGNVAAGANGGAGDSGLCSQRIVLMQRNPRQRPRAAGGRPRQ